MRDAYCTLSALREPRPWRRRQDFDLRRLARQRL